MFKKIIISLVTIIPLLASASITDQMDDFFNDSVISNYTGPKSIHSQNANYLSGGSAQMRSKVKMMQFARMQAPSLNASCSGIDAWLGGFSYISSGALIDYGEAILTSAPPVAVRLALKAYAPTAEEALNYFQSVADTINNFNMSTCQAAEIGVGTIADAVSTEKAMEHTCKALNSMGSKTAGWLASKASCDTNEKIAKEAEKAKEQKKNISIITPTRNITWYILNHPAMIDADTAQYIMSLVGTVVFHKENGDYTTYSSLFDNNESAIIKAFLEGGETNMYKCVGSGSTSSADGGDGSTTKGCLQIESVQTTIKREQSFQYKILTALEEVEAKIKSGKDLTEKQLQFLASISNIPVYASIRADMALGRMPNNQKLAKILSTVIMENFITYLMVDLDQGIANNKPGEEILQEIKNNARNVLRALNSESKEALKAVMQEELYYQALANKQALVDNIVAAKSKQER